MKSLNLVKPLVIQIVGLPGSGKSFFAKRFSETFGAPVVSYDRLRFELFSTPTFSTEEQDLLTRIATYQIEELLKGRATFLIDGGCNTKRERLKFAQLAKKQNFETLVIWVQTHESTAKTRATKRSTKQQDDKFNTSLTSEQFIAQAKRLSPPSKTENIVVISGMHTYSTQAKAVLRKLVTGREAEARAAYSAKTEQTKQQTKRPETVHRNIVIR